MQKKHSFLFFLFLATLQHEALKNTDKYRHNTVNGDNLIFSILDIKKKSRLLYFLNFL